jgi:hypothetical protein
MNLKFAWEVFNVSNSVRFDTNTNTSLDNGPMTARSGSTAELLPFREFNSFL